MRNPSIHITESSLKDILKEVISESKVEAKILSAIVRKAKKHSINHRCVIITNDKLDKKVEKVTIANTSDVFIFNNILFMVRKSNNHFGVRKINESSRDWLILKDITKMAVDFCNEFELDIKIGFKNFIELGLLKMNKFSLLKFKSLYEAICNSYVAKIEMNKDEAPGKTKSIHDYYVALITERTGNPTTYIKDPDNYCYFIEVRKNVDRLGIKFEDYIKAQFTGMEWRDTIPHPAQLVGQKANDRLNSYLYNKGIKVKKGGTGNKKNILTNIKNMK